MSGMADRNPEVADEDGVEFTRKARIEQLNEMDTKIASLLRHAGEAVKALTDQPLNDDTPNPSLDERRAAFKAAATSYFSNLSFVDVNLRRQIYALEEANIIAGEPSKESGGPSNSSQSRERTAGAPGGIGNLDVGWLNSRNDKAAKNFEAEIWGQGRKLLEDLENSMTDANQGDKMEV